MDLKKITATLMCVLAFTVVFAHSVIPHEHHCLETHESHIHHFGNCEQLNTYILSGEVSEIGHLSLQLYCIIPSDGIEASRNAGIRLKDFLFSEYFFSDKSTTLPPLTGRRAPPEIV